MNQDLQDIYVKILKQGYEVVNCISADNIYMITLRSPKSRYEPSYVLTPISALMMHLPSKPGGIEWIST